jgi:hypothetical protein
VDPRLLALPPSGEPTRQSLHITSAAMLTGHSGDRTLDRRPSDRRAPDTGAEASPSHLMSSKRPSSTGVDGKSRRSRTRLSVTFSHGPCIFWLSHLCLQGECRPREPPE